MDASTGEDARPGDAGTDDAEFARIVAALRGELRTRSLRAVAREVGMSPTGLRGLLDGAEPYGRTRERLREWWWRGREGISPPGAEAALRRLLGALPDPSRGMARVLDTVEQVHRESGAAVPSWVAVIRGRLREGE